MEKENNELSLLVFFWKYRKPIIILGITAAILSAIVSLLMEEKFQSSVVLYPAATNSLSKALFEDDPMGKQDVLKYGEEEEAEQMLQILQSDEIRNYIVGKYDLLNHYEIKPDEKYKNTKLVKEFESNVSFERTKFQSVRIEVLDKDPQIAADIANDIAAYLDTVKNRMQRERAMQAYKIMSAKYQDLSRNMDFMVDSLRKLGAKGVIDQEKQVEKLTEMLGNALLRGNRNLSNSIQKQLDTIAKYGGAQEALSERIILETEYLVELRDKLEKARVDVETMIPAKFIVNNAVAAEKKAWPIRWLIVAVSTMATVILSVFALLFIENFKKIRQVSN